MSLLWAFPAELSSQSAVEVWLWTFWCEVALVYNNAIIPARHTHSESAGSSSAHHRMCRHGPTGLKTVMHLYKMQIDVSCVKQPRRRAVSTYLEETSVAGVQSGRKWRWPPQQACQRVNSDWWRWASCVQNNTGVQGQAEAVVVLELRYDASWIMIWFEKYLDLKIESEEELTFSQSLSDGPETASWAQDDSRRWKCHIQSDLVLKFYFASQSICNPILTQNWLKPGFPLLSRPLPSLSEAVQAMWNFEITWRFLQSPYDPLWQHNWILKRAYIYSEGGQVKRSTFQPSLGWPYGPYLSHQ